MSALLEWLLAHVDQVGLFVGSVAAGYGSVRKAIRREIAPVVKAVGELREDTDALREEFDELRRWEH